MDTYRVSGNVRAGPLVTNEALTNEANVTTVRLKTKIVATQKCTTIRGDWRSEVADVDERQTTAALITELGFCFYFGVPDPRPYNYIYSRNRTKRCWSRHSQ